MREQLWRKESAVFTVEILVGKTWVRYHVGPSQSDTGANYMTLLEATVAAKEALRLPAVKAVRVGELETVQSFSYVLNEKKDEIPQELIGMQLTGQTEPCPRCRQPASVSLDGTTRWVMCMQCNRALPVN